MKNCEIIPIILCGGSGTRLWPASRDQFPKQFLSLTNDLSLLQNTIRRALNISNAKPSSIVTVALNSMKDPILEQLNEINPDCTSHILWEPCARNTAAAVALAANYVDKTFDENAIMWVLPADHHIGNEEALEQSFEYALTAAEDNKLVTFGITPRRAETGYGYIRLGKEEKYKATYKVDQFIEKPDSQTAKSYLESGEYLWNSGMFLFTAKTVLEDFKTYAPDILSAVQESTENSSNDPSESSYKKIPIQPFDRAIMEKSDRICVVPCDPQWSDIGSWESLWNIRPKNQNGNAIKGDVISFNSQGCMVQAHEKLIVLCGLKDTVIIETDDVLFIADKNNSESLKKLVQHLRESGHGDLVNAHHFEPKEKSNVKR